MAADLQAIYEELVAGDETARNRLIEAAMPLAISLAKLYTFRRGQREELISCAYVGLCSVAATLKPGCNDIGAFISSSLRRRIWDSVLEDSMISTSARNSRRLKLKGTQNAVMSFIGNIDCPALHKIPNCAAEVLSDVIELCETERERNIIALRSRGHTDSEIGQALGCSQPVVQRSRKAVEARYNEQQNALSA